MIVKSPEGTFWFFHSQDFPRRCWSPRHACESRGNVWKRSWQKQKNGTHKLLRRCCKNQSAAFLSFIKRLQFWAQWSELRLGFTRPVPVWWWRRRSFRCCPAWAAGCPSWTPSRAGASPPDGKRCGNTCGAMKPHDPERFFKTGFESRVYSRRHRRLGADVRVGAGCSRRRNGFHPLFFLINSLFQHVDLTRKQIEGGRYRQLRGDTLCLTDLSIVHFIIIIIIVWFYLGSEPQWQSGWSPSTAHGPPHWGPADARAEASGTNGQVGVKRV